jgi:hypothetical protein
MEEPQQRFGGRKSFRPKRSIAGGAKCTVVMEGWKEPEQRFVVRQRFGQWVELPGVNCLDLVGNHTTRVRNDGADSTLRIISVQRPVGRG